jgi:hypothetical protein
MRRRSAIALMLVAVGLVGSLLISPQAANAAIISSTSLTLTNQNGALDGSAPFGTVKVDLLTGSNTAQITFTAGSVVSGGNTYDYFFGGQNAVDVNVNASSFSISSITPSSLSFDGSGNVSTFGNFNATFKNTDGSGDAVKTMSFIVTNNVGTWSNSSLVLTPNGNDPINFPGEFFAAAHVFEKVNGAFDSANTGFVSDSGQRDVTASSPEPLSLGIWGLGLACCSVIGLRRRRALARA